MNEKIVEFEIISKKNHSVHQDGFVSIIFDDAEEIEDVEWTYYDQNSNETPIAFIRHDDIGITDIGASDEQVAECDKFRELIQVELVDWVTDSIIESEESDNKTLQKGDIIIKINGGARFVALPHNYESNEFDSQYYGAFKLYFNDKPVMLNEDVFWEDPFTFEEIKVGDILYDGGYVIELPKSLFEGYEGVFDTFKIIEEYKASFEKAYKKSLVKELGVFGEACDIEKQDGDSQVEIYDKGNAWEVIFEEKETKELYFMTTEEMIEIIKEEIELGGE